MSQKIKVIFRKMQEFISSTREAYVECVEKFNIFQLQS